MMGLTRWALTCVVSLVWTTMVWAQSNQDVAWIQIEAHPSLATAQQRVRLYAAELDDVNGFALPGGWFGITLGPYLRADAEQVLRVYRRDRLIPADSYIAFSAAYRRQFFPVGANVLNRGVIAQTPQSAEQRGATATQQDAAAPPPPPPADETPAEARRSEQLLTRAERQDLQVALKWAGFYNAAIDGAFGRGTRGSMAAWQEANGFDKTGILTTKQREALFKQYNAVLDGMDLQVVTDVQAGVQMQVPTGVVRANGYDYPFAKFDATGDVPAQVLFISQAGDQATLFGLYDIMETLEIVPLDGKRERRNSSFLLIGENDDIVSHTEAELKDGAIKGFTLVWPAGDEERRTRVLDEMRASFERLNGVLDPTWSDSDAQAVDLVAGLQIRRPRLSRSGFFVNDDGAVVTTLEAVQSCTRVTLDEDTVAEVSATNDALGLAVLTPQSQIAPRGVARFAADQPRLQSQAVVAGFSYEGILGAPTVSFGSVSDLRGLAGEDTLTRLDVETLDGDAGGPVFDETGSILGMLLPRTASGRQLPGAVSFAAKGASVQSLLDQAGVQSFTNRSQDTMAPEDITVQARDITVLVSCWDG